MARPARRRARRRNPSATAVARSWPLPRFGNPGVQIATVVMLVIAGWLLISFVGQVMTGAQMDQRKAELQSTVVALESDTARLNAQLTYAESPDYADKVARDQLGMAKPGDTIIVVPVQPTAIPSNPTPAPLPTPAPQQNWQGWARALAP